MPDPNPYAAPESRLGTERHAPRGDPGQTGCYLGTIGGGLMALGFLVFAVSMTVAGMRQGDGQPFAPGRIAAFAFAAIPVGFILFLIASFKRWLAGRG